MGIFDIIGPVMVGPSSSHTAGAARIGFVARNLLGEDVKEARILLYGSFLATGKGHGTDKALVAGLLGMSPDDGRIADSLRIAEEKKVGIEFGEARLKEGHPNTVELKLKGVSGKKLDIIGESIGGGRINIAQIVKFFPILLEVLPVWMWYCIGAVLVIRACSYVTAAVRYHRFASLHTILNKATGFCVFCLPYMLVQDFALRYCEITCVIAGLASTEEFLIHLLSKEYEPGRKFIWKR